ncbi:GNAT family N-acetyltransferase [Micromonospora endolithica]|uniref:GNAT family N-acetyltransferase n=1 Tax=Micromonospora endolithica TaxID=230091 RepID=A0A3A9YSY6_9ACTN|nr:GNAT family N-acetyltransferase [Micromonospora endolithica]RKN39123.1 GNAT family N-acetyltransferase [Micromonospora endolithica]TWJ25630.1 N-acetylglutamate synthase-like GNAT family acetyltransferase [Micromonospora endolithica]
MIREARPDDAADVVALRAVVHPYLVRGVESTRKMIAEPPAGEDWTAYVAEVDGRVVGWVSAFRNIATTEPDVGEIALPHVHPAHRRRGLGHALVTRALDHVTALGVRRIVTWAQPDSVPFARRHGFTPSREVRYAALDLRPAPPAPEPPPGVLLHPLAGLDPRRVHRLEAAAADEPSDVPFERVTYEYWLWDVWENLGLDREASTAVEVDGELVAFSLVKRDGDRMWSDYTGTLPEHRGRGFALLAKRAALHRAAGRGVRVAYTSNDAANAPMLAVNARLGYRPVASQWSCLRGLTG